MYVGTKKSNFGSQVDTVWVRLPKYRWCLGHKSSFAITSLGGSRRESSGRILVNFCKIWLLSLGQCCDLRKVIFNEITTYIDPGMIHSIAINLGLPAEAAANVLNMNQCD
jgi:hypothetical protein